jgi:hypothetical protein
MTLVQPVIRVCSRIRVGTHQKEATGFRDHDQGLGRPCMPLKISPRIFDRGVFSIIRKISRPPHREECTNPAGKQEEILPQRTRAEFCFPLTVLCRIFRCSTEKMR